MNKQIFETIYHAALEASCELAERCGTYETYEGSPVSKGVRIFNFLYKFTRFSAIFIEKLNVFFREQFLFIFSNFKFRFCNTICGV